MIIRFDTQEVQRRIDNFQRTRLNMQGILRNIILEKRKISTVSWLSPAAKVMADKLEMKANKFTNMIAALNGYTAMLMNALEAMRKAEGINVSRAEGIRTDAFGGGGTSGRDSFFNRRDEEGSTTWYFRHGSNSNGSVNAYVGRVVTSSSASLGSASESIEVSLLHSNFSIEGERYSFDGRIDIGHARASVDVTAAIGRRYTYKWDDEKQKYKEIVTWFNAGANVAAGASVLAVSGSLSSDSYTITGSASVLGAGANAGLNASIGSNGVNAYVTARAMAYAASGRVEGTFNLGPISIGGRVYGYAGAVGASWTGGWQNRQFTFGGSAAVVVGAGGSVSIGINPDFIPTAATTLQTIGEHISNTATARIIAYRVQSTESIIQSAQRIFRS